MVDPLGTAAPPSAPRCRVWHSSEVTIREPTRPWRSKSKTRRFQFCAQCGFAANPENKKRYKADGATSDKGIRINR